jgi:hypothetical protein
MANPVKVLTRLVSEEGIEISGSTILSGTLSVVGQHTASFYNLDAVLGNIPTFTASNLSSEYAYLTNVSSSQVTSSLVSGTYGYFENLKATYGEITYLTSSDIKVANLSASNTITAPNFLIDQDSIIASNVIQVNELVANYISASQITASNLIVSEETVIIGDYIEAGTLYVNNDAEITGNLMVSADVIANGTGSFREIFITKPENYYVIRPAYTAAKGLDLIAALKLLDQANGSVLTTQQVESAYRNLRFTYIGTFNNGAASLNLTALAPKFTVDVIDHLSVNIMVRNLSVSAEWRNDLVSFKLRTNNNKIYLDIEAATDADQYKIAVVNENGNSFSISPY